RSEVFEANSLTERELTQWIQEKVNEQHIEITVSAIQELLRIAGTNLMNIHQEIEKMCLYVGSNNQITEDTVHLLVPRTLEQNIFELIEKVVNRKPSEALRIFYDLLQNNEEPIKILALLANQFRLI